MQKSGLLLPSSKGCTSFAKEARGSFNKDLHSKMVPWGLETFCIMFNKKLQTVSDYFLTPKHGVFLKPYLKQSHVMRQISSNALNVSLFVLMYCAYEALSCYIFKLAACTSWEAFTNENWSINRKIVALM